jgi:hypothetical protein
MTQAVKFGVLSLSASSESGDDSEYLRWHQLDHMPQQWEIPGMVLGQRWVSTPECRAARTVEDDRFAAVNHVVHYLWGEPLAQSIDDFFTLGADLYKVGRFPHRLPAVFLGGFDVASMHAAPSAQVSADVVPFRPNRGMQLLVEYPKDGDGATTWRDEDVAEALATDGVAGMWTFAPGALRLDRFDTTGASAAVLYLDDDPVTTAARLEPLHRARWSRDAIAPALAAPFAALRPWEWDRHGNPGPPGS